MEHRRMPMPPGPVAGGGAGELFRSHGRAFWKIPLPAPAPQGASFVIAQSVAGRYEPQGLLALGATTVLVRAVDIRTHQAVLLKALRTDWFDPQNPPAIDPELFAEDLRRARHLLQTERRLLVRLRNAGCGAVPNPNDYVYDVNAALASVDVDPALVSMEPYLVLQEVRGITLEALLDQRFPEGMPEADALRILRPVVEAIALLQEPWTLQSGRTWHCVYQDLKPANILIDPLGRPVLIDFGGCQLVVDGTPVLEGACTAGYAPPECAGPARVLLGCADVYTVGSTLYHMLTGSDPRDRLRRWRGEPGGHLALDAVPRDTSQEARRLLARCLAARPSDRPASARQVLQALDELGAPRC